ncbi:hypothetical protein BDZ85DRAFT_304534 [Elsinoe ampelina]|uniref:PCI domain-containing protein n=1 Tax=Elsinoe ampelina TaxID=302913 RepID=A0A6A6G1B6_9PEZI|nr:hypothetical protein BDZ85DRAFT_304534 [Elsinoe ampelina]
MDRIVPPLADAFRNENGYALAAILSPIPPPHDPSRITAIASLSTPSTINNDLRASLRQILPSPDELTAWTDIFTYYHRSLVSILTVSSSTSPSWTPTYQVWRDLLSSLHRAYTHGHLSVWTLPLLYQTTSYLRTLALRADATLPPSHSPDPSLSSPNLEDCARQINRVFALVTQDRTPMPNRKYGTYRVAVLLFKTYFRLNSISLCKNIVRSINASAGDMPPLEFFPKAHRVSYAYYVGVVAFLEERYEAAESELEGAYALCLAGEGGARQAERILTYLVPVKLLVRHVLPSKALLARHGRLEGLFGGLVRAVKRGDLKGFDEALADGEEEFVRMRVYLTLERGRDVCARNLLRRVYLNAGWEGEVRRSRIPVAEWRAGLKVVGEEVEGDEVEALIAGLIYKNLIKGYISRAHSMVVLNKKGAFPGTGV